MDKQTGYELSRNWFDFCFENPEKIKPNHTAVYFFAIEHCNRLGWKTKFGFPSAMVMEAIGIKSYNTYINALNDLVEFGFIKMIEKSKNQYSSNIIALSNFNKALAKALDKALIKHGGKQRESIDSINKQLTINKEQRTKNNIPTNEFVREREVLRNVYTLFDFKIISALTEIQKNNWLDTINKLNRLDGFGYPEIEETIIWARNDDFWQSNFLSILGLRKKKNGISKFFQMNKKMNHGNNGQASKDQLNELVDRIRAENPDM